MKRVTKALTSATSASSVTMHGMSDKTATAELLKELQSLRRRVQEMEDDTSSGTRSSSSEDYEELADANNALRRELAKVNNEKAHMERDFMNQLSMVMKESAEGKEQMQSKASEVDEVNVALNKALQSNASLMEHQSELEKRISQMESSREKERREWETQLANSKKESSKYHSDMTDMAEEIEELETLKAALLEDLSHQAKTTEELRDQMEQVEEDYQLVIAGLQDDIVVFQQQVGKQNEEIGHMNDVIIELEGQKEVLLDDLTAIRLRLESEESEKAKLNAQIEQLVNEQEARSEDEAKVVKNLKQQLKEVEGSKRELQEQLTADTLSYQEDIARLEKTMQLSEQEKVALQSEVEKAQAELRDEKEYGADMSMQLARERCISSEQREEIDTLKHQLAEFQDISTSNTLEAVKELNAAKEKLENISRDYATLEFELSREKRESGKLRDEVDRLKDGAAKTLCLPRSPPMSPSFAQRKQSTRRSREEASSSNWAMERSRPRSASPRKHRRASSSVGPVAEPGTPVKGMVECFERRMLRSNSYSSLGSNVSGDSKELGLPHFHDTELIALEERLRSETELVAELRGRLEVLTADLEGSEEARRELEQRVRELEGTFHEYETRMKELQDQHDSDRTLRENRESEDEVRQEEVVSLRAERESDRMEIEQLRTKSQKDEADLTALKKMSSEDRDKITNLRSQIDDLEFELTQAKAEIQAKKDQLDVCRTDKKEERPQSGWFQSSAANPQNTLEAELNNLRVTLIKTQVEKADMELRLSTQIEEMEINASSAHEEFVKELEMKENELENLRGFFNEKVEEIARLQEEREQICSSMNSMSCTRKEELEELQSDLMAMSNKATSQARQIQSLKMQLEEQQLRNKAVDDLREKVAVLEDQLERGKGTRAQMNKMEIEGLRTENNELRDSVRNLTLEKRSLQEKLNTVIAEKGSSRAVQVLRERNEVLKKEVEKLTRRLRKMENSITRFTI